MTCRTRFPFRRDDENEGAGTNPALSPRNFGPLRRAGETYTEAEVRAIYFEAVAEGRAQVERDNNRSLLEDEEPTWRAIAAECAKHLGKLRDNRERTFVREMVSWTECGQPLSERQAKWLADVYKRVRR
jgi:hypothetical protein